jgi:hypothetical protein
MDADGAAPAAGRAADVFAAELRPRPGGVLWHRARIAATLVSELLFQLLPVPSVHDVVVLRRDDGTEVLRVPAGDPYQEGDLLRRVRAELADSDPEAFLRAWTARDAARS